MKSLTVTLSDGRILQNSDCTDELFAKVKKLYAENNEFEMINLLIPEEKEEQLSNTRIIQFWGNMEKSSILTQRGDSVYWEDVSPLSMPMSFAEKVMKAERNGNENLLQSYKNFWTLLSLNPDPIVRENLFKFLDKWGMVITKSGLFVGYRNVDVYQEGETLEQTIFTDHHSHTTRIQIGKMVTLPREECDCDSSVECSRGLHIGGTSWLQQHYFGGTGLCCLVNPVDVVAVPWCSADYGKIRTCAYLPIAEAEYDEGGRIIPFRTDSGFEEPFVSTILYDGIMTREEIATYTIPLPKDRAEARSVSDKVLEIAKQYMRDRL